MSRKFIYVGTVAQASYGRSLAGRRQDVCATLLNIYFITANFFVNMVTAPFVAGISRR